MVTVMEKLQVTKKRCDKSGRWKGRTQYQEPREQGRRTRKETKNRTNPRRKGVFFFSACFPHTHAHDKIIITVKRRTTTEAPHRKTEKEKESSHVKSQRAKGTKRRGKKTEKKNNWTAQTKRDTTTNNNNDNHNKHTNKNARKTKKKRDRDK